MRPELLFLLGSLVGALAFGGFVLFPGPAAAAGSHDSTGELTRQFLARHAEWAREDSKAQAAGMKALVSLAALRQQRLAEMMADHPDLVLRDALPAATRASLPSQLQGYVETEETIDGELEILHRTAMREAAITTSCAAPLTASRCTSPPPLPSSRRAIACG